MNDNAKTDNGIRLNKYLSESGICSRREADRLIEDGKVTVDGRTASMGMKVFTSQEITVNGKRVEGKERPVLLAVNKPRGIVCTTSDKDRAENIVEFLKYPVRIYPVGRLDKDSEGLLLMTNQGELVNRILRGRYGHEKEYLVTVDRPVTEAFIRQMRNGVEILGTRTKPCEAEITGERSFSIILTQGLNRQIRRMCEALGYRVETDHRSEKIGFKIRQAQLEKVPYMLVVGDKEAETGDVAVRNRHGEQTVMSFDAFAAKLRDEVDSKALEQN